MPNINLLRDLSIIHSVSGDESAMSEFILNYIHQRKSTFKVAPEIFAGDEFHDCILLKFGQPRTAVFAHMDTIGFMSRYSNQLVPVGGPEVENGIDLIGEDSLGPISCKIQEIEGHIFHDFPRKIDVGTRLSFKQELAIDQEFVQGAYLDNRLGIYNALLLCEELENGWIVFTTYEETGGGSMPFLLKFIQENAPIKQALISDITWVTDGVHHHHGVVISLRDKFIPRKKFIDRVVHLAEKCGIPYQLEVEGIGASDGREVQFAPYAIDWCFVGAPEDNVHTPFEKVSLFDLGCMVELYKELMRHL